MSNRSKNTIDSADSAHFPNRQAVAPERQPGVVLLIMALFAGGAVICTALIAPILLTAVTEIGQPPRLTYQQCGVVRQDTSRLACYDRVLRQNSLHSAKDVRPDDVGRSPR
jgi:hypothetical protein